MQNEVSSPDPVVHPGQLKNNNSNNNNQYHKKFNTTRNKEQNHINDTLLSYDVHYVSTTSSADTDIIKFALELNLDTPIIICTPKTITSKTTNENVSLSFDTSPTIYGDASSCESENGMDLEDKKRNNACKYYIPKNGEIVIFEKTRRGGCKLTPLNFEVFSKHRISFPETPEKRSILYSFCPNMKKTRDIANEVRLKKGYASEIPTSIIKNGCFPKTYPDISNIFRTDKPRITTMGKLHQSSKSVVYAATYDNHKVVLKEVSYGNAYLFYNEIAILQELGNHENIIKLITYYGDPYCLSMVTELANEGTLHDLFFKKNIPQFQSCSTIRRVMVGVITGLEYLHCLGIIHKDIKPKNIFIVSNKDGKKTAKLGDFDTSSSRKNPNSFYCRTRPYTSPEQEKKNHNINITEKTDLYSLAMTSLFILKILFFVEQEKHKNSNPLKSNAKLLSAEIKEFKLYCTKHGNVNKYPGHFNQNNKIWKLSQKLFVIKGGEIEWATDNVTFYSLDKTMLSKILLMGIIKAGATMAPRQRCSAENLRKFSIWDKKAATLHRKTMSNNQRVQTTLRKS